MRQQQQCASKQAQISAIDHNGRNPIRDRKQFKTISRGKGETMQNHIVCNYE
jgi:hypothetical protein